MTRFRLCAIIIVLRVFNTIILGLNLSPASLGRYAFADNLAGLPHREGLGPVKQVLFPACSKLKHEARQPAEACLRAQRMLLLITTPIGACLMVAAELMLTPLIGEKRLPAVPIPQVFDVLIIFEVVGGFDTPLMANYARLAVIASCGAFIYASWVGLFWWLGVLPN